jgi:hypothetical protein
MQAGLITEMRDPTYGRQIGSKFPILHVESDICVLLGSVMAAASAPVDRVGSEAQSHSASQLKRVHGLVQ